MCLHRFSRNPLPTSAKLIIHHGSAACSYLLPKLGLCVTTALSSCTFHWFRGSNIVLNYMSRDAEFAAHTSTTPEILLRPLVTRFLDKASQDLPPLDEISLDSWTSTNLSRRQMRINIDAAAAPPIGFHCTAKMWVEKFEREWDAPMETLALYGLPPIARERSQPVVKFAELLPDSVVSPAGIFSSSPANQLPGAQMHIPEPQRLIFDSGKLAMLDGLLERLKREGHRCLIYFQMTRMIDLMEEYMIFRQYRYLRLDGDTRLEDRRDMVMDWQTKLVVPIFSPISDFADRRIHRDDYFCFLLSTRAGGLGINLTGADTVIFYECDWNPSNDAQAMDRAHRLGQTRQVTVYRLITRGTIDQRIIQMAGVKKDVSPFLFHLCITPQMSCAGSRRCRWQ